MYAVANPYIKCWTAEKLDFIWTRVRRLGKQQEKCCKMKKGILDLIKKYLVGATRVSWKRRTPLWDRERQRSVYRQTTCLLGGRSGNFPGNKHAHAGNDSSWYVNTLVVTYQSFFCIFQYFFWPQSEGRGGVRARPAIVTVSNMRNKDLSPKQRTR